MAVEVGIAKASRQEIAEGLSDFLADTYTLYLKTHYYHWNVTGPMFHALHVMFEEQYQNLWNSLDVIAERIRALGFPAPGTYAEFSRRSTIQDDGELPEATEMVRRLLQGHECAAQTGRKVATLADEAEDYATTDLVTERLDHHEKTAWMLRSTIQT